MLMQTNLVIIPAQSIHYTSGVTATNVDICDMCGGLFARPGGLFMGMPHTH